jgi:hypothetical protein
MTIYELNILMHVEHFLSFLQVEYNSNLGSSRCIEMTIYELNILMHVEHFLSFLQVEYNSNLGSSRCICIYIQQSIKRLYSLFI